jgi:spermidine synthase
MPYPVLIGGNPAFLNRFKRVITQNNFAFTFALEYDGDPRSLAGIDQTIYAAAYEATSVSHPRVATIGVGGGFDILTALYFEAREITAVEINAATVKILTETYRDYFRACVGDPRVHLVQSEGRHYLVTTPRQFDVLQLSGVDSYSGTPGAANVFSENYLYTAEAFDLYLSRLTDEGVINLMRLEYIPPREMLRALTTAVAALRRAGAIQPAHHIIMLTANEGNFTALLVKKKPFTESEEQRLSSWAATNKFLKVSAAPRLNPAQKNFYQSFLALDDAVQEQAYYAICPFNVAPVTDNRPFFFRYSRWRHLWPENPLIRTTVPAMEISLTILFFLIGLAAIICVWLPLRLMGASPGEGSSRWRYAVAFAGTAVGYLVIEIALFQKFSLFLGHPNYALSVVLAVLLLSSGFGSLFSATIMRTLRGAGMVSLALAVLLLLEQGFILPKLAQWVVLSFIVRAMIVAGLVMPLGLLMGTFVPTALDRLKARSDARFVPWAWGINGIFSVLAPVLSIALSVTWGINVLLLTAIPLYLAVGFTFPPLPDQ